MRSVGIAKRLYFIRGMMPTEAQQKEADGLTGRVSFRNANMVDNEGGSALEECDSVHGEVPARYAAAFPASGDGDVSGVGALRTIHLGEKGVTENQALHLDSRGTGNPVEEERRRAYRGPAVNSPDAVKAEPGRLDPANAWGRAGGVPGAATLTAGELGQVRSEQQGQPGSAGSAVSGWAPPGAGQPSAGPTSGDGAVSTAASTDDAAAKPPGTPTFAPPAGAPPAPTA